jgi:hypothetical protein
MSRAARGPQFCHAARHCRRQLGIKLTKNLYADVLNQIRSGRADFIAASRDGKAEMWVVALGRRYALAIYAVHEHAVRAFLHRSQASNFRVQAIACDAAMGGAS